MVFTAKHLLDDPFSLVTDALEGLRRLNPQLDVDVNHRVVFQAKLDRGKVALISGGGAGHEPAHAGFVGDGILTAAVSGNVFASPNAGQVRKAIELVDGDKGTLIVIKNYTGDILNFGLAREQYLAAHPTKSNLVKFLVVGDDVAVGRTQGDLVGRRGLAGTVLVYKIAGALARQGSSLDEVYSLAKWISENVATIGVGLDHCHVPGTDVGESHLKDNEIELGMGIHNEPGFEVLSPTPSLIELIPKMLNLIVSTTDPERSFLPFSPSGGDEVVLLINNLGGISELELAGIVKQTLKNVEDRKINVRRVLCGTFMTSLNMPGFSITLLLLPGHQNTGPPNISAEQIIGYLDEKTDTTGWKWNANAPPQASLHTQRSIIEASAASKPIGGDRKVVAADPEEFRKAIERACRAVIQAEPEITRLDQVGGDGDAGLTLKRGAEGVLTQLSEGKISGQDVVGAIQVLAKAVSDHMDGTSGALYSIFFSALAQAFYSANAFSELTPAAWAKCLSSAFASLLTYTRARPPSRTLIDPLSAFVLALGEGVSFEIAVGAAAEAAEATKTLRAKAGRAAYIDAQRVEGVADPGAWGVKVILEALASTN